MNKLTRSVMAFLATCQVFMLMASLVVPMPPALVWSPAILAVAFCLFLWVLVYCVFKLLFSVLRALFS